LRARREEGPIFPGTSRTDDVDEGPTPFVDDGVAGTRERRPQFLWSFDALAVRALHARELLEGGARREIGKETTVAVTR